MFGWGRRKKLYQHNIKMFGWQRWDGSQQKDLSWSLHSKSPSPGLSIWPQATWPVVISKMVDLDDDKTWYGSYEKRLDEKCNKGYYWQIKKKNAQELHSLLAGLAGDLIALLWYHNETINVIISGINLTQLANTPIFLLYCSIDNIYEKNDQDVSFILLNRQISIYEKFDQDVLYLLPPTINISLLINNW